MKNTNIQGSYVFLSENTAGLELFHVIKVRTWLVSLRDACITNSPPSGPDVVNCTHENRQKFKFFNQFVHMCLAIQHRKILMTKIFSRYFFRLLNVSRFTKRKRISDEEFLPSSVGVKMLFHNFKINYLILWFWYFG